MSCTPYVSKCLSSPQNDDLKIIKFSKKISKLFSWTRRTHYYLVGEIDQICLIFSWTITLFVSPHFENWTKISGRGEYTKASEIMKLQNNKKLVHWTIHNYQYTINQRISPSCSETCIFLFIMYSLHLKMFSRFAKRVHKTNTFFSRNNSNFFLKQKEINSI